MQTWKRILLKAAGFGAGFAVTAAVIVGLFVWWSGRPKKPKPWNKTAITASYDHVFTEGDQNNLVIAYTLQNNTDTDIQIQSASSVHFAAQLQRPKSFAFIDDSTMLTTDFPVFIPAKSRVRFKIRIGIPYPEKQDTSAPDDVQHDWVTKVCKYLSDKLSNLDGFSMLIDTDRYEVDLPNGWRERGKEPLRVKALK
jgi:hypothetical protein